MNGTTTDTMNLIYADTLPMRWYVGNETVSGVPSYRQEANRGFFRAITILEDLTMDASQTDERGEIGHELSRIEAKVDLLTGMVTRLVFNLGGLPPLIPVSLSATGIDWSEPVAMPATVTGSISAGTNITIELYLRPDLPLPVYLPAIISSLVSGHDRVQVVAKFTDVSGTIQEYIERTIFRRHRQAIARSRAGLPIPD